MFRRLWHMLTLMSLLVGLISPSATAAAPAHPARQTYAAARSAAAIDPSRTNAAPAALPPLRSARPPTDFIPAPLRTASDALAAPPELGASAPPPASAPVHVPATHNLPLAFTPNAGQIDAAVRFLVRGSGGTLFFAAGETVLALPRSTAIPTATIIRLRYLNANPAPQVRAGAPLPGVVHELIGNDATHWHTNLPTYAGITYAQLYDGIDLQYAGTDGQLKSTYQVAPGADPARIRWRYRGATEVHVDTTTGDLVITLPAAVAGGAGRTMIEHAPLAWQDIAGQRVPVAVRYTVAGNSSISFALGAYDSTQPLTIDPVLSFSTYLGGASTDQGNSLALDSAGNAYLTGYTLSNNFPTQNPEQGTRAGSYDAFVTKLSANGQTVLYSTYLGGSGDDRGKGIAVDSAGNILLTGETESTNFPTLNALDSTAGGGTCGSDPCNDIFVTAQTANGSALRYSTYLGGSGDDENSAIAVDSAGNAYVTGLTAGGIPTLNAYQGTFGGGTSDAFMVELNPAASGSASLLYGTYLGGGAADAGNGITVDSAGKVYLTGETSSGGSTPFPTKNAYQSTKGSSSDAFVTKLDPTASGSASLLYSTFLGGNNYDKGFGIAVNSAGMAYVTGYAQSTNFPTLTPLQAGNAGDKDGFVAKLNPALSGSASLLYSSYLGGAGEDRGLSLALDSTGKVDVTGFTKSSNFPTQNPEQGTYGGGTNGDAFVAKIAANSPAPTATPTATPTNTPTNTPTATATSTPTSTPTTTPIPTNTPTATSTSTPTATPTNTPTSTNTPTATPTNTSIPTNTPTNTPTDTPTSTPTATATSTPTNTPTNTPTSTPTATPTPDTQAPTTPLNLHVSGKTDTTVSLTWDAATDDVGVTGYEIFEGATHIGSADGTIYTAIHLSPNTLYTFTVKATDAAGNVSEASTAVTVTTNSDDGLPDDPAVVAPTSDQTVAGDIASDTQFLYTGPDPFQTGVVSGTIAVTRTAVLRGRVLTDDSAALSGVTITILDHPEYGQTLTRADGMFDMVVNGGGLLTINYSKDGYLPVQRSVTTPWRDYAWLPGVVMVSLDPIVNTVTLTGTSELQVAQGSPVTDADGTRQATLLFPANVTGTMVLSDGTQLPLTTLHVRASEYTIGANGPKALPGPLPANSGYTYAVEYSVDEALATGATDVRFSQPIVSYVENFIGFPVGGIVPAGYYDREKAAWIASDNGRIIKIIDVTNGHADLDIDGDNLADDASTLGVTDAERQRLASEYPVGQELWRVPIAHFTPWDFNL
jgi:hypothetical protein